MIAARKAVLDHAVLQYRAGPIMFGRRVEAGACLVAEVDLVAAITEEPGEECAHPLVALDDEHPAALCLHAQNGSVSGPVRHAFGRPDLPFA